MHLRNPNTRFKRNIITERMRLGALRFFVCVLMREREKERETESETEREIEREKETERERERNSSLRYAKVSE